MTNRKKNGLICPRCGSIMNYQIEVELKHDGTRIVYRYYRCPVCRYKITDSVVTIKRINGKIVTEAKNNKIPTLIESYSINKTQYLSV